MADMYNQPAPKKEDEKPLPDWEATPEIAPWVTTSFCVPPPMPARM